MVTSLSGVGGSTTRDVAEAYCIENNEMAQALQEQDLEKVKHCPLPPSSFLLPVSASNTAPSLDLVSELLLVCLLPGGEVPGWLRPAELHHAHGEGLPRHRLEPVWRGEVPGLPAFRRLRQRSVLPPAASSNTVRCRCPAVLSVTESACACVCCPAGESVEENANVVVRLLIRRPECFGPALRGEGGAGLLAAIEEAIKISEDPARDGPTVKKDRRFPM